MRNIYWRLNAWWYNTAKPRLSDYAHYWFDGDYQTASRASVLLMLGPIVAALIWALCRWLTR